MPDKPRRFTIGIYLTPEEHKAWRSITHTLGENDSSLGAVLLRAHIARDKYLLDRKTFLQEYAPYIKKEKPHDATTA